MYQDRDPFDICEGSENISVYYKENGKIGALDIPNFQYVCCNIPGQGTNTANFEDHIQGCSCCGSCCSISTDSECTCVNRYGAAFDETGKLRTDVSVDLDHNTTKPITECNTSCSCQNICWNRVVQKGIRYKLEVYSNDAKGFCLRCLEPIITNSFVCEYAGEVLTEIEAKRRGRLQTESDMNYIFVLREHCASGVLKTYIDPCNRGNIGRFLNHSCDPNLFMVPVRVDNYVPKLCLFALRDISAGEELTYDYAGTPYPGLDHSPSTPASAGTFGSGKHCACSSANCRGVLPFEKSLL